MKELHRCSVTILLWFRMESFIHNFNYNNLICHDHLLDCMRARISPCTVLIDTVANFLYTMPNYSYKSLTLAGGVQLV